MQQPIYIEEYNYLLPDERISKYPLTERDSSKLLLYKKNQISEDVFFNIDQYLPENALLIYNNTKVIQARLIFRKQTGARIEVFCLEPIEPHDYALILGATDCCTWKCMVGNLKKWKDGVLKQTLIVKGVSCDFCAERISSASNTHEIKFSWNNSDISFAEILDSVGELPIPPYLNRATEESDRITYQTVYSQIKGSVAAPTAGLHFTERVFEKLRQKNITTDEVTLHVGAGTFQPVKTEDANEHTMHSEIFAVPATTIKNIKDNLENIVAVGTTSVRTLESLYFLGANLQSKLSSGSLSVLQNEPYNQIYNIPVADALQNLLDYLQKTRQTTLHAETQIMIKPSYEFRIVKAMITNFHQPKSTLLLLVSAFVKGNWGAIYNYALENDFRFLSYGDSSLLFLE